MTAPPIMPSEMSLVEIFVSVPQECMGFVIGPGGSNIKQLAEETHTTIITCSGDNSGFSVTGTPSNGENAKLGILRSVGERVVRIVDVPKDYMCIVLGPRHTNKERIETETDTKIRVPPRQTQNGDIVQLKVVGLSKNCDRARGCIRNYIAFQKQKMLRHEFGGDEHFVCFAYENESETFLLKPIQGQGHRIETEFDNDGDDDDYLEREISEKTISDIKDQLMTSLEKLKKLKDEKQLIADLWCHFGKVFVTNIGEEEKAQDTFTPAEIKGRIAKLVSQTAPHNEEIECDWRVSFVEGIDVEHINDGELLKCGGGDDGFLGLKLVHTQWRYDFGFITPTYRIVRLKVWEGLPPDSDKPPVEVKNILRPVFLQGAEDINAWICYPSISVLRGEIMTPNLQYDCRMKLRAGSRYVTDKDSSCIEEDDILADYLSYCKFDQDKHCMHLPDEKEHEVPEGFDWVFYREAKEKIYQATVDEDSFTVIVLSENGWDSDSSEGKKFGIRVVMNSWSEAMLSPGRRWNPDEILQKLESYVTFLSLLQNYLF